MFLLSTKGIYSECENKSLEIPGNLQICKNFFNQKLKKNMEIFDYCFGIYERKQKRWSASFA